MRFTLVDQITALEAHKSIAAHKNLTLAEEYLADHFPGFPIMPGVLMLEAMVQASAWLMRYSTDFAHSTILLKEAKALKFNNLVSPGHTLQISASVHEWTGNQCVLKGSGTVDGKSAVSARLTLEQFNLRDKNPKLAKADELGIGKLRELFSQLWKPLTDTQA